MPDLPRLLALGHQLREWNVLLVPGGLMDQPYRLWTYVQTALAAEDHWYALQARLNPGRG